jgi:hypothetical protein
VRRVPVISTNILSVAYDRDRAILEVEFQDASVYHYLGVPERHYLAMTSGAGSVGRYFNVYVKGHYRCERIL